MRILVLIKQSFNGKNMRFDGEGFRRIAEKKELELNYDDGGSLERVLRFREEAENPEDIEIAVLSMGNEWSEDVLLQALAVGCDRGILISDPALEGADTKITAQVLAGGIRKLGGADLIFAGEKSQDGRTGNVGPMVAEYLRIPHLSAVEEFSAEGEFVHVVCSKGAVSQKIQVEMPCLLIPAKGKNDLRTMSLPGITRAMGIGVEKWDLKKVRGSSQSGMLPATEVTAVFHREEVRLGRIVEADFSEDRAEDGTKIRKLLGEIKAHRQKIL